MEKKAILSIQDLNIKFNLRGQLLHAIRGVSLDLLDGECLAIVGESGSGKSVLVKSCMGLLDKNGFSHTVTQLCARWSLPRSEVRTTRFFISNKKKSVGPSMPMEGPTRSRFVTVQQTSSPTRFASS